ncbi:MAG: hypothetical protein IPL61_22380 [Myxococcales bacterium]|nr:hypothetical protein [Myxococcales bacterium]
MCIFSRAVRHVGATRIFAGHRDDGRQALIYAMDVELDQPTAMVLPLPTPPGVAEGAVEFVSLAAYPALFDDLDRAFPVLSPAPQAVGRPSALFGLSAPRLAVHDVGAFVASFAPTVADLDRLDPRFRLSAAARAAVTRARDGWSFAVVQLKPGRARQHLHPLALTFPRRDPTALYFPTVHVHGDALAPTAGFDHTLYYQPAPVVALTTGATPATGPIGGFVELARARGLLRDAPTFAVALTGRLPNDDVYVLPPAGLTDDDVAGRGPTWAYQLATAHGDDLAPGNAARRAAATTTSFAADAPPHLARWHRTARTRGRTVAAALRGWCERFAADHAAALTPLTPSLPAYYYNGPHVWSATTASTIAPGPGVLDFRPWSDHVEFQRVEVGFARMPDAAEAARWRADLIRTLEAAATA